MGPEPSTGGGVDVQALQAELAALKGEVAGLRAELAAERAEGRRHGRHHGGLLASFSHEMRTSLNDITGFASILDDEIPGRLNPRQRGFLGKIIGGAERLLRLVENLAADGALEAGGDAAARVPTDVAALVRDAVEPLRPMAANKMTRIQVAADVPGRPLLDRRGVALVVANLVSNALRLNGLGGMVDVAARVDGDELLVGVRDYGPGLTADEIARALAPAEDPARQGASEYGVALARKLVEAHGGRMGVDTVPGAGTTFWFRLPYREGTRADGGAAAGEAA